MFKNATYLSFYFADNQLFSNSETLVIFYQFIDKFEIEVIRILHERMDLKIRLNE